MMKRTTTMLFGLMVAAATGCGGKAKTEPGKTAPAASLYDRLGGKPAIEAVVNDFVGFVAEDARINAFFKNSDIPNLKKQLVDQICDAASAGQACQYKGKDMKTAHTGMGVKDEHFAALVEDLVRALDKNKVGQREKDDLLGALAPMKSQIVQ